jgi:hypothetical protein
MRPGRIGTIEVSSLVVIDDLDVMGVTALESEADTPRAAHRHRPLASPSDSMSSTKRFLRFLFGL